MKRTPRHTATDRGTSHRQLDALLARLVAAKAPTGHEDEVRTIVAESIPRGSVLSGTALGSLHVNLGPSGPNRLLLAVAMDEPSLIVASIDSEGRARLASLGHVEPASLVGHRLRFLRGGMGVIVRTAPAGSPDALKLEDLAVEFGAADREECPVATSDVGVFESALETIGGSLVGRSVAARGLLALLLGIAGRPAPSKLPVTMGFLAHASVQDRGLGPTASAVAPQRAILLRPFDPDRASGPRMGGGPVLGFLATADTASRDLAAWIHSTARRAAIPCQEYLLAPDDNALVALQGRGEGMAAATLELPVANLGTPGEMIRRADLLALQDLLVHLLRSPDRR